MKWVDFGSLSMPHLPLRCIPTRQVDVLRYFPLSQRRRFGRIQTSSLCFCPPIVSVLLIVWLAVCCQEVH